jgi:hypothetical protein
LTFCAGGSTTLTADTVLTGATTTVTYAWRRGPVGGTPSGAVIGTSKSLSINQAGTYNVTISGTACNNVVSATVTVTQSTLAANAITFSGTPEFCAGSSKTLTANPAGGATPYAYQWILGSTSLGGASSSTYNATQPGSYTYVVTDSRGCSATSPAQALTQNPVPTVSVSASTDVLCTGSSTSTLTATPGSGTPAYAYQWKVGGSNAPGSSTSATYAAGAPGSYTVVVTDSKTCSVTSTATVISASTLAAQAIGGSGEFCAGSKTTLSANFTGGVQPYSYQWKVGGSNITGATSSTYDATAAGSYTVVITDSKGCSVTSAAKVVTQNPLPSANAGPGGTFTCTETYNLTGVTTGSGGTGTLSYQWSTNPGGVTFTPSATVANPVIGPFSANTTVQLTVTDSKGCSAQSSSAVTFVPSTLTATVAASPSTVICAGQTITLTATASGGNPGYTYQWKRGATNVGTNSATLAGINIAGSYTVTITDTKGCTFTPPAVNVTASNLATSTPAGNSEFCQGSNTTLTASVSGGTAPLSYQWQNGGTNIGGANGASYTATAAGSYSVIITDNSGCTVTSSAKAVSVNPVPTANAGPGKSLVCNEVYDLGGVGTGSGGTGSLSYNWSTNPGGVNINNASGANPVIGPFPNTQNYTISLTVTDSKGCSATSQATVTKGNSPLTTSINAPFNTICPNSTVTMTSGVNGNSGGPNYQWQNNGSDIGGANGTTYTASGSGSYRLVVTDNRGCRAESNTITLNNSDLRVSISSPNNFRYCDAGKANFAKLLANPAGGVGNYQYKWAGGGVAGQTTASVDVFAGFYNVTVTDAQGCTAFFGDVEVKALPRPTANAGPGIVSPASITGTQPYDLTKVANFAPATGGTPGYSYQWRAAPDTTVKSTADKPVLGPFTRTNTVTLIVTDANGCKSDPASATVTYRPCTLTSKIVGNAYVCSNNTTALTATTTNGNGNSRGYKYQWRNNGTLVPGTTDSLKISIARGGLYTLTAIDSLGCQKTDSLRIQDLPQLLVSVAGPSAYCRGSNASLVATVQNGSPKYTFEWRNGTVPLPGDSSRYFLQGGGNYTVSVTDSKGCTAKSTQAISVVEKGTNLVALVTNTGPTTVYAPNTVTLNAQTGADYVYQWRKNDKDIAGATTPTYIVTAAKDAGKANYAVAVTNGEGCTAISQPLSVEVIIPTAVAPIKVGEFAVNAFPSPTSGRLQVEVSLEKATTATMHLTDLSGRTLSTRVSAQPDTRHVAEFDLTNHPGGLYLLRVEAGGQHTVQKVLKVD